MDVAALKETIAALQAALPDLPKRVDALVARGQALREECEELVEAMDEREPLVDEAKGRLQSTLDGLFETAHEGSKRVQDAGQEVDAGGQELVAALTDAEGTLESEAAGAGSVVEELKGELQTVATEAETMRGQADEAMETAQTGIDEAVREVGTALDEVEDGVEDLVAAIDDLRGRALAAIDRLQETTRGIASDAAARIDQAIATLQELQSGHEEALATQRSAASETANDLLEEVEGQIETGVSTRLGTGLQELAGDFDELAEGFRQASEVLGRERDALESGFTHLGGAMEPLPAALAAVKAAANKVGLSWE